MKFAGVSFVFILTLFSCSDTAVTEKQVYDGPMLISEDVEVIYTDSARVKFIMKAEEQIKLQNENEEFRKGIFLEFFDRQEQKESTLTSKYAFYDKRLNQWFVKGDVVLNNFTRKRILKSEELYWSSEKAEVW